MAETINTYQETPEDASHTAEMLEKAEQLEQTPEEARPDWLPEKFQSPEAMAEAYRELEQKLSRGEETEDQDEEAQEEQEWDTEASPDQVEDYLDQAGLNYDAFVQEFMATGGLSDDAYEALQQAGIPQDIVDQYIEGQQAIADDIKGQAYSTVGGEREYSRMIDWATNNLSQGQIDAFNASLETGDVDQAMFAIQGLAAQYRSDVGTNPNLMSGGTTGTSAGSYQSVAEVTRDMADPRYDSDPAFRQMVALKLQNSNVI
jgi:type II secretory pathway component GspD/PulD (secretin)